MKYTIEYNDGYTFEVTNTTLHGAKIRASSYKSLRKHPECTHIVIKDERGPLVERIQSERRYSGWGDWLKCLGRVDYNETINFIIRPKLRTLFAIDEIRKGTRKSRNDIICKVLNDYVKNVINIKSKELE